VRAFELVRAETAVRLCFQGGRQCILPGRRVGGDPEVDKIGFAVGLGLLIVDFLDGVKCFSPLFLRLSLSRIELSSVRSGIFPNCECDERVMVARGEFVLMAGMLRVDVGPLLCD
jgi:hypothetical protein